MASRWLRNLQSRLTDAETVYRQVQLVVMSRWPLEGFNLPEQAILHYSKEQVMKMEMTGLEKPATLYYLMTRIGSGHRESVKETVKYAKGLKKREAAA